MRNYKKQEIFYKVKNSTSKTPIIWIDLGRDHDKCRLNPGMIINKFMSVICDGVFFEKTFHVKSPAYPDGQMEVCNITPEIRDYINYEIDKEPKMLTLELIKLISLNILNNRPFLHTSTCLGWKDFEDKSKNPNWFDGVYVFPDGNYYTVCLKSGSLRVYPGKGDGFGFSCVSLPLTEGKINLQQWADKCNGKKCFIEFE